MCFEPQNSHKFLINILDYSTRIVDFIRFFASDYMSIDVKCHLYLLVTHNGLDVFQAHVLVYKHGREKMT